MDAAAAILDLLEQRAPGKTICPSEAARKLSPDRWRDHMDAIRAAGKTLAARGAIDVTQKGEIVDPGAARGAIRYRLSRKAP